MKRHKHKGGKEDGMTEIILTESETNAVEKAAREAPPEEWTGDFLVFPDEQDRAVILRPYPSGATLRLDRTRARLLADQLIHQTQSW